MRRRRSDPAEPWSCRRSASTRSASTDSASWPSGFGWGSGGFTTIWCLPPGSGTELDAANVRRAFRTVAAAAGLDASEWTPRELRHSFVSLLSSSGVPIEDIAHLVGHASTSVTEKVYRKELRPVLSRGATAMDALFGRRRAGRSD